MPKLAANLSMMFQEVPFLDRFAAAASAGFTGVEFLFPYDFPRRDIAARFEQHGLTQALFNLPPGDWAKGERGLAALPGREGEFMAGLERALDYARATKLQATSRHGRTLARRTRSARGPRRLCRESPPRRRPRRRA